MGRRPLEKDKKDNNLTTILFCREKNGTDVSKLKELEGRYRILPDERKFIIDRTVEDDNGLYSCLANNQKRDFNVVGKEEEEEEGLFPLHFHFFFIDIQLQLKS